MVLLRKFIAFGNTCFGQVLCRMFGYSSECARTLQTIVEEHFRSTPLPETEEGPDTPPFLTYLPPNLHALFNVSEELTPNLPESLVRGFCVFVYNDSAHIIGLQKTGDGGFLIFDTHKPEFYMSNSIESTELALLKYAQQSWPEKTLKQLQYVTLIDIFKPEHPLPTLEFETQEP
ncbi:MAG: hypothetical protein AB7F28_00460 [Candidatus Margulisiibacteriota bacterium]